MKCWCVMWRNERLAIDRAGPWLLGSVHASKSSANAMVRELRRIRCEIEHGDGHSVCYRVEERELQR